MSENPGVPVVIRWLWAYSVTLVEIGLTDLSKSGCAMAHPAQPGTTGLSGENVGLIIYLLQFHDFYSHFIR
jgi:hypothetical protein